MSRSQAPGQAETLAGEPQPGLPAAAGITPQAYNLELVGQIGGATLAVAQQGQFAYVGVGGRLVVLDISNPAHPALVGESALVPGTMYDLAVAGDYVYTAFGYAGLRIFDVSDPLAPAEIGHVPTYWAHGLALVGQYAYVTDASGLCIVDVSDPGQPHQVGFFDTPAQANDVVVAGNYACVAEYVSGLRCIDISVPSNPRQVGFLALPGWNFGVSLAGNRAYLATAGTLQIVDVTDPANPVAEGYCATPAWNSTVVGQYAYVAAWDGLEIVDVSDPDNPLEAGFLDTPWIATHVAVGGGLAYVADERSLRVINVANPSNPTESGFYAYDGPRAPHGLAVRDTYAYVADEESGVSVIDLRDPARPDQVGTSGVMASAVAVAGDYAYAVSPGADLQVVDVSRPAAPVVVGTFPRPGTAVAVAGNYAYVAAAGYGGGLRIVDVSNAAGPTEVGAFEVSSYPMGVAVSGSYAYLADENLRIVDVSNPSVPIQVGYYESPGQAFDVVVAGSYAYLADRYEGLRVLDVSDPANPNEIGWFDIGYAESIALAGNYVYVGNGYTLYAIDVSDPFHPLEAGLYELPFVAMDVAAQGNYVYVADDYGGLLVLWFSGSGQLTYTVSGRVIDDESKPMPGVTVWAGGSGGDTTDANGDYNIERLVAGEYTLTAGKSGCLLSPAMRTVSVPPDATGQDFSGRCRFSISGRVRHSNHAPFAGVEVSAGAGYVTVTGAQGEYLFGDLLDGAYSITPSLAGYAFWPANRTVTLPPDAGGQDFVILAEPVSTTLIVSGTASLPATLIYTDTQGLTTTLDFPAGAITQTARTGSSATMETQVVTVVLTPTLVTGGAGLAFAGHAFDLNAYRAGTLEPGLALNKPVTVTIHYSAADVRVISAENELALWWWTDSGGKDAMDTCQPPSVYDRDVALRVVSVPICHLSLFGLLGPANQTYLPLIVRSR